MKRAKKELKELKDARSAVRSPKSSAFENPKTSSAALVTGRSSLYMAGTAGGVGSQSAPWPVAVDGVMTKSA